MSEHSDVDLFVARVDRAPSDIDAFQVKQATARALFDLGRPELSQGGQFLKMHTAESLCTLLGTPADDAANTLTARMLLLLESKVLLGEPAYDSLLGRIVDAYWKNEKLHQADYQPYVLVNDIIRYWRILLLNYEAKNAEKEKELEEPKLDAERRIRSYKLRFSRCMTCFSALAALLSERRTGNVTKLAALGIFKKRPVERLLAVRDVSAEAAGIVDALLIRYQSFLEYTDAKKDRLLEQFADPEFKRARADEGYTFGDHMFALLQELGKHDRSKALFRHMVV